jgi:ABC-type uncharacterized transport system permease subunit
MSNSTKWIGQKMRLGWLTLAFGLVVGLIGVALERMFIDLSFNTRIVTGVGIFLIGLGVANLVRYGLTRGDDQAARRLVVEERDERTQLLRARAGQRAYYISAALTYILLMWVSFADNGSLPALSNDALWLALAAMFLLPVGVYLVSIVIDQRNL